MEIAGKIVVITGAGSGIGRELALRAHREGATHVAVADLNEVAASETAAAIGATARAYRCDVSREADIQRLVRETEASAGGIGLFCSNAGIISGQLMAHAAPAGSGRVTSWRSERMGVGKLLRHDGDYTNGGTAVAARR